MTHHTTGSKARLAATAALAIALAAPITGCSLLGGGSDGDGSAEQDAAGITDAASSGGSTSTSSSGGSGGGASSSGGAQQGTSSSSETDVETGEDAGTVDSEDIESADGTYSKADFDYVLYWGSASEDSPADISTEALGDWTLASIYDPNEERVYAGIEVKDMILHLDVPNTTITTSTITYGGTTYAFLWGPINVQQIGEYSICAITEEGKYDPIQGGTGLLELGEDRTTLILTQRDDDQMMLFTRI